MSREIPLTQNHHATVDDEDHARLSKHKWCFSSNKSSGYAVRKVQPDGTWVNLYLHRTVVPPAPRGHEVIFRNHDTLDCRKSNLAMVTTTEARRHHRRRQDSGTSYKGVAAHACGKYVATIRLGGRAVYLGQFQHQEEAARAYDRMAAKHFGPFAELNFPSELPAARSAPALVGPDSVAKLHQPPTPTPHARSLNSHRANPASCPRQPRPKQHARVEDR